MTILRSFGATGGLLAGMAAGALGTGLGIAALVATTEPAAEPEPAVRLDLAMAMPRAIDAVSPVDDRQTKVLPFSTVARMMPVDLVEVAAPTDSTIGVPAMPGRAVAPIAIQAPAAPAAYEPAPVGPRHFLQGGYFAKRGNAVDLASELAGAGLNVLVKQTTNVAGEPRWLVLIGPYTARQDALGARRLSPDLLADAFAVERQD